MSLIRNKLIAYIKVADETQIKALYALLEKDIEESQYEETYPDAKSALEAFKKGNLEPIFSRQRFAEDI
jgi:hypothetical protein